MSATTACTHPASMVVPVLRDGAPTGRGRCVRCGATVLLPSGLTEVTGR